MKRQNLMAVAGVPAELGDAFVSGFAKTLPILSWLPLNRFECYTRPYCTELYERVAGKLKAREPGNRGNPLANTNLLLLYLDKQDGSESEIFSEFGIEAMIAPMPYPEILDVPLTSKNQRHKAANDLIREGRRAVRHAQKLLAIVAEEVTNRDNKTCLLCRAGTLAMNSEQYWIAYATPLRQEQRAKNSRADCVTSPSHYAPNA